jgi:hypothetical protein
MLGKVGNVRSFLMKGIACQRQLDAALQQHVAEVCIGSAQDHTLNKLTEVGLTVSKRLIFPFVGRGF